MSVYEFMSLQAENATEIGALDLDEATTTESGTVNGTDNEQPHSDSTKRLRLNTPAHVNGTV